MVPTPPSGHWSTPLKWHQLCTVFTGHMMSNRHISQMLCMEHSSCPGLSFYNGTHRTGKIESLYWDIPHPNNPTDVQQRYSDTYRLSLQCEYLDNSFALESSLDHIMQHLTPPRRLHTLHIPAFQSMCYLFVVLWIAVFRKIQHVKEDIPHGIKEWRSRGRYKPTVWKDFRKY